jgi:hypothetical protein
MNRRTLIAGAVVAIAIIVFVMVVGLLRFNFTEVLPSWLWVRRGPELVVNGSFEDGNHETIPRMVSHSSSLARCSVRVLAR